MTAKCINMSRNSFTCGVYSVQSVHHRLRHNYHENEDLFVQPIIAVKKRINLLF